MGWITNILQGTNSQSKGKKSGKQPAAKRSKAAPKDNQKAIALPFRAVSIYSRVDCCGAADRLVGRVFLAAHAPQLPLGGCTEAQYCKCRYKYLEDRRQDLRRDTDHGLPARSFTESDRRSRRDRRRKSAA